MQATRPSCVKARAADHTCTARLAPSPESDGSKTLRAFAQARRSSQGARGARQALFQKIVADAALDSGRAARILTDLGQPADHPVALNFPESRYLKGLLVQVGIEEKSK